MSSDSGKSHQRRPNRGRDLSFDDLPVWDDRKTDETPRPLPASKVPPTVGRAQRNVAPQTETLLKALGLVLVISALVAALVVALPRGGGNQVPTATADPGMVIASSEETPSLLTEGSPVADSVYDARNAETVICIDPGHGGRDMGHQRAATVSAPAMDESYFNLAIARDLQQRLEARGFKVILTRNDDIEVNVGDFDANQDGDTRAAGSSTEEADLAGSIDEMQARIDRCNDERADIMISVQVGGSSDPAIRGSRVIYDASRSFGADNQALSYLIYEELGQQMRDSGYPWIGQGVFEADALTEQSDDLEELQLLLIDGERPELKEPSAMPGAIVEVLTLTNDADAVFLSTEQGIASVARALDVGIIRFVETVLREQ